MRGSTPPAAARMVVVYERQPYWEPELRRQFQHDDVVIHACRTVRDLEQITGRIGGCLVVVDLSEKPVDVLRWMSRRLISGRALPVFVLTNSGTASLRWHASEMGAAAVLSDDCGGQFLARLCRRQWTTTRADRDAAFPAPDAPSRSPHQIESKLS